MFTNAIFTKANARRKLLGLAIGVFGISAAVACTGLEGIDQAAAQAIVQNVDSLSGEVTVQFKDGTTTTFNLADVDVAALSQLIGDASMQAGDEIEIELDSSNNVKAVTPHTANLEATIVAVDADANTMTIEAANGVQIVLTLTVDTRIELDEHEGGTVSDLAPGMLLKVKYDTDTNEALKIKHDVDDENDDENEVKGVITAINADDHTITVDADGVVETYTVLADTEIKVNRRAPFSELQVGMLVQLEFDSATLELTEVKVKQDNEGDEHGRGNDDDDDEGELKGTVTAIDTDAGSITVEGEDGVVETYVVHSDTEFENGALGDVTVGTQVKIEFDAETLALSKVEVKSDDDSDQDEDVDHDSDDDGENDGDHDEEDD